MSLVTPVVQFGTSRFLQAHADLFLHEAAEAGQQERKVTVVAGSGASSGHARLAAFNDAAGFPVILRGIENGGPVERQVQVRSVARGIDAEADWRKLRCIFVGEVEFVISNTTEQGFAVPAGLALDLSRPIDAAPPGFAARLLALLQARFEENGRGITVLPTELLARNGALLRDIVVRLARASGATEDFVAWIETDCVFANSLVDRIVSAPLEPAGAVAEPYALWAVEAQPGLRMPCEHPAIRIVDDLEPVERLKIHILNLGHTVLAEHWMTSGLPAETTVRGLLADPAVLYLLRGIYDDEVLPGFARRGMAGEAAGYVETTLDRFRNPFLDHRIRDIASGHAAKVARRIGGFLEWTGSGPAAPRLGAIAARHAVDAAT